MTLTKVDVTVTVDHPDHDELRAYLEDPQGNLYRLFYYPHGISPGVHTWTLTTQYPSPTHTRYLSPLIGDEALGSWKLKIGDYRSGDVGRVTGFTLTLTGNVPTTSSTTTTTTEPSFWDYLIDHLEGIIGLDRNCSFIYDDCIPQLAGMSITLLPLQGTTGQSGSIGLGGLNTTDGDLGFVTARHIYTTSVLPPVYQLQRTTVGNLLGTVVPVDTPNANIDAMFVKYPPTCDAIDSELKTCSPSGNNLGTVEDKKIYRSSGRSYDVVAEATITNNMNVFFTGFVSGQVSGTVPSSSIQLLNTDVGQMRLLQITGATTESQDGDSGGPVYTLSGTDASIVGIVFGSDISDTVRTYFTSWSDVKQELDLQSIP